MQTEKYNNMHKSQHKIITQLKSCAGCSACANICPVNAITMTENQDGYYIPSIDETKCVHCGQCDSVCPELNAPKLKKRKPEVYACQASDEIRAVSSSGGVFTLLAEQILSTGGYVVGAAFAKDWTVHHTVIDDINDLDKLRRSKYVQSYIKEDLYKQLKQLLNEGKEVLFSGCPCQIAGFKNYLGKDYKNLLLVDLLCAHSASPKAYRKFLESAVPNQEIKDINFRSKIRGWSSTTTLVTDKQPIETITHDFMRAFIPHLLMNKSCMNCKYNSTSRLGDITIGDYWGIGSRFPHLDDRKGTSCVFVNTKTGQVIFNKIKSNFKTVEEKSVKDALKSNRVLKTCFSPHPCIKIFNQNLDKISFRENVDNCLSGKYNVAVMGWFWVPNRGAILTNYALNEAIKALGYNVKTIDFIPGNARKEAYNNSIAEKFTQKHIELSNRVNTWNDLKALNNQYKTFICGSDQLWRWRFRKKPYGHLFLNFVEQRNKIISYSTSFGLDTYEGPQDAVAKRIHWLKRFDHISVREFEGVDVLKNIFGVNGTQVMDPVFLIDKSKYDQIIKESDKTEQNFVAYYMIANNKEKMNVVKMAQKKYRIQAIDIKKDLPVEDWLYYIKNCKILITDSFHATCFATIYNKHFIAINVCDRKTTRIETLLKITNMENRFLNKPSDITGKDYLFEEPDYIEANINLQKEIERSKNWLKEAIESPKVTKLTPVQSIIDAILNTQEEEKEEQKFLIKILQNKNNIYFKYYFAKIMYNLTFGKTKSKIKEKKYYYKVMLKKLREYNGEI